MFGNGLFEVVGPAALDLVDPDERGPEVSIGQPAGQCLGLALARLDWLVHDERLDVPLVRSPLALPHGDAEAEEVEPVPRVHDLGLGLRKVQKKP